MTRTAALATWLALGVAAGAVAQIQETTAPSLTSSQIRSLLDEARFAEAEKLAQHYIDQVAESQGSSSLDYARALDLLVEALVGTGKGGEDQSRSLAFEALDIKEQILPEHDGGLATTLTNLGILSLERGEPETARPYLERALTIGEAAYGRDHSSLIRTLRSLGIALRSLGDLETAEDVYRREGDLIADVFGPEHIDAAANAYNTAWLLVDLGDFAEAERLFDRARRIVEQKYGATSPRMVWVLLGLGAVRDFRGNHALAIDTHERALDIAEEALGPEHPLVASCETGLGAALMHLGDYQGAYTALQRSLELTERTYGTDHENTGRTLKSLAEVAYKLDDLAAAEAYLERAMQIFEHTGADYLRLDAQVLAARNLADRGAHAEAIEELQSALGTGEEVIPDHPDLVIWQVALGDAQLDAGRNQEASATYLAATGRAERLLGVDDPMYLNGLSGLATANARSGETQSALKLAARTEDLSMRRTRFLTASLPERQALRVAEERASSLNLLLTLAATDGRSEAVQEAWHAVIGSRAAVLDELAYRRRLSAAGHVDSKVAAEYATSSRRLANLLVQGASGGDTQRYNQLIDSARVRRETAEKRLAAASTEYRRLEANRAVGFKDVMSALPADAVLVAFVLYLHDPGAAAHQHSDLSPSMREEPRYAALVAIGSDRIPKFVTLGAADEIDGAVADWRQAVYEGLADSALEDIYRRPAQRLRQLVWDPITAYIGAVQRIYVVPDGRLHLVNLAALPGNRTEYLVDRLSFQYLSSERDLASEPVETEGSGLLALGGPDYEDTAQFAALQRPESPAAQFTVAALGRAGDEQLIRSGLATCPAFREVIFPPLPGTETEAEAVVSRWDKIAPRPSGPALLLWGSDATEGRFKREAPGSRVLHVATHGFFLEDNCPSVSVGQRGIGGLAGPERKKTEAIPMAMKESPPLRLSGLVLAGANHRGSALPDEEDGILTAEEIAALELGGVEWAVLSGCDTGIGEIRAGEGVFGLRRAFRAAGVQTLIMSLWPVRDDATTEWMEALYEARLKESVDTMAAVTEASRAVLQRRRQDELSTHPALWAGFVASGEH